MSKIWFVIVTLIVAVVMMVFLSELAIALLVVNASLAAAIGITQLLAVITVPRQRVAEQGTRDYFVSIHVPCHNEPFGVVKRTLTSLANLDYQNYEVLVIDNNTQDAKIWRPIQNYCQQLGSRFKFLHFDHLAGFKAGALNAALKYMDKKTKVIAVVDADYVVDRQFLRSGVNYFGDPAVVIVQYPQAYYNTGSATAGLELEYSNFFDNILEQANSWDAITATGTLSLLRADLFLSDSLRWNEWCITEDAEISIHLHVLGYKGVFINQVLGRGLIPFNYYSLQRQRERWIHGNTQIIRKDLMSIIKNQKLNWKQKISFITQLTAWFHPNYFPIIFLSLALLIASYRSEPGVELKLIGMISLITIVGFMLVKIIYFFLGLWRRKTLTFSSWFRTVVTHFGLTGTMSLTWLWAFSTPQLPFNRTTKDPGEKITPYLPIDGALAGILFSLGSLGAVYSDGVWRSMAVVSAIVSIVIIVGILYIVWQTREAKKIAHKFISFPD